MPIDLVRVVWLWLLMIHSMETQAFVQAINRIRSAGTTEEIDFLVLSWERCYVAKSSILWFWLPIC